MLVLGRKSNESLMIGDDIVVTILEVDGDKVKIGIQAPAQVRILRQELFKAAKKDELQAANLTLETGQDLLPSLRHLLQK